MMKKENLKKLSVMELKESLNREEKLLKNKTLINKLPDKGESIKKKIKCIQDELKIREDLLKVEESLEKLSLGKKDLEAEASNICNVPHNKKLILLESSSNNERFKPFCTLNKVKTHNPEINVTKLIEDAHIENHPTKLITLPESLELLSKQEERVKDEQMKCRLTRNLEKMQNELEELENDEIPLDSCDMY